MNNQKEHTLSKSILLHLFPGVITGTGYFALVPLVNSYGYPSILALILSGIILLMPIELGYLFIQKRKSGESLTNGIIKYLKPIPFWQYLVFAVLIFVSSGILFTLFKFSSDYLFKLFNWIPSNLILDLGLSAEYAKNKLIITYLLFLIFIVFILPITEDIYFRGYLLPRIPLKSGNCSVLLHSGLFALYHVWTPWMFITRTFGILPLSYFVKRKENIYIGILAHCLLNSIDFITAMIFLLNI